ncbi:MAG TPA: addiction module protein, partial [Rhizomicrobium sp.]|nr:addiction module protein [Rhizomicrobium sp.]
MRTIDVSSLTVEERLDLLDEIWESLYATPEAFPLQDWQRAELDHRLNDLEREGSGSSWEDVENR